MNCQHCNEPNPENWFYCRECGKRACAPKWTVNSFMWSADNSGGMVGVLNATQDADAASDTALGSLTNIQADANTGNCDLEMIIASV